MESLRSRLEALLEQELSSSANDCFVSNSPILNENLNLFYIETPTKLKDLAPYCYNDLDFSNIKESKQEKKSIIFNKDDASKKKKFSKALIDKEHIDS